MKKLIFLKLQKDVGIFFLIITISLSTIIWIIQAVNFLDLVSEDGHSLKVYFLFTLHSLPKIISKILPFIFMLSLFYTLIKYEMNNELVIFWMNGITKIKVINSILKISLIYFFIQILFTSLIVPYSLDKGRSYFRTSEVDLFTSIIKKKKFIDSVENLTIFVENKKNNFLENIIIKEKINLTDTQIIIAQTGEIVDNKFIKAIILNNGKIINNKNNNQNIIDFDQFSLDLSKYSSNTIRHPKTQEMNSKNLILCLRNLKNFNSSKEKEVFFIGCSNEITSSIIEEFLKRFFSPLFIILIALSSSLILLKNKDQERYKLNTFVIFCLSVFIIIVSEISLRYSSANVEKMVLYTFFPILFFMIIYGYIFFKHKNIK